jgi:hypothetical protein
MEQERCGESPGSEALQIFKAHTDNLEYLLEAIVRETGAAAETGKRTVSMMDPKFATAMDLLKTLPDGTDPNRTVVIAQLSTSINEFLKPSETFIALVLANAQTHRFLFDWMLAMMVTFAEAYLENALLLLTTARPELMATNDKLVSGDDVLKQIQGALPAEKRWQALMEMMRQRWAKQFLRAKPKDWITRLEKFGAPKYRKDLAAKMTTTWRRRHEIVHAPPPIRSVEVAGLSPAAVARFVQSRREFEGALVVIFDFVQATDAFIVDVLNAHPSTVTGRQHRP